LTGNDDPLYLGKEKRQRELRRTKPKKEGCDYNNRSLPSEAGDKRPRVDNSQKKGISNSKDRGRPSGGEPNITKSSEAVIKQVTLYGKRVF